jgi:hypothetical protein
VLQQLEDEVTSVQVGESSKFMLKEDKEIAASLSVPTEDKVWFLPYEDHFLKAFIDRTVFIEEKIRPMLSPADKKHHWPSDPDAYRKMPSKGVRATGEVRPSIWLNGRVIGRWEMDEDDGSKRIVMSLYSKTSKQQENTIKKVRSELEEFINSSMMQISGGKIIDMHK